MTISRGVMEWVEGNMFTQIPPPKLLQSMLLHQLVLYKGYETIILTSNPQ